VISKCGLELKDGKELRVLDVNVASDKEVLASVSQPVVDEEINTPDFNNLLAHMAETMYATGGIGLAAIQVGVPIRVAVLDTDWVYRDKENPGLLEPWILINPEVGKNEHAPMDYEGEGCLSCPGLWAPVERPMASEVRFKNHKGEDCLERWQYLASYAVNHEVDHMNGTLILNYLSALRRDMYRRKIVKIKRKVKRIVGNNPSLGEGS